MVQYEGAAEASVTRYTYDGVGNLLTATTGLSSRTDTGGKTTTSTYDRFGNVLTETDALGQVARYQYTSLGAPATKADRNGATTTFTHDALGRLENVTVTKGNAEESIFYGYTLTGQLEFEENANQRTEYAYDALGRLKGGWDVT